MPAKLGDPDEQTVAILIKMPASMKAWLDGRRGGASKYVRELVEEKMPRRKRKKPVDPDLVL